MRSPTRAQWLDAVAFDLDNMARRDVWTVVELPNNCQDMGTVWVFKTKLKPDGALLKHKARLCAQGFSQIAGLDFNPMLPLAPRQVFKYCLLSPLPRISTSNQWMRLLPS